LAPPVTTATGIRHLLLHPGEPAARIRPIITDRSSMA
jgi:hypothetical protein